MRGILIKIVSNVRKQRMHQVEDLLCTIANLERINKSHPDPQLTLNILQARQKLRNLLFYKHKINLNSSKSPLMVLVTNLGSGR